MVQCPPVEVASLAHRVARHWNRELHALRVGVWENSLQRLGCGLCLWPAAVEAILELEEGLPDRVRERDPARVHEGNLSAAPALERERERKRQGEVAASAFTPPFFPLAGKRTHLEDPGDGATQGACPEEETPRARDLLRLEAGEGPPLHQLQVQVHRGRGPLLGVQGGRQVGAPRPKAALQERARGQGGRVALPVSGQMLVGNPCI